MQRGKFIFWGRFYDGETKNNTRVGSFISSVWGNVPVQVEARAEPAGQDGERQLEPPRAGVLHLVLFVLVLVHFVRFGRGVAVQVAFETKGLRKTRKSLDSFKG
jgi:hypothetical protein